MPKDPNNNAARLPNPYLPRDPKDKKPKPAKPAK